MTNGAEDEERVLYEGRPAVLPGAGELLLSIVTLGVMAIVFALRAFGTHYRVTNKRVVVERGLLSKRLEQVDLHRINDFVVDRPFGQRLLGTGNLILRTLDATTPVLEVRGVKTDVKALYEALRKAVEIARQARGVRIIE